MTTATRGKRIIPSPVPPLRAPLSGLTLDQADLLRRLIHEAVDTASDQASSGCDCTRTKHLNAMTHLEASLAALTRWDTMR